MGHRFSNPKEVFQFLEEREQAANPIRRRLAWTIGVSMCYDDGVQWISDQWGSGRRGVERLRNNYVPGSGKPLIATNNITSRNVEKISAHTHPSGLYMDVTPADRDASSEGDFVAQIHESVINCGVDWTGLLDKAQIANHRRCVAGTWGLGLTRQIGTRWVGNAEVPDQSMQAIEFNPAMLILDPAVQDMRLENHEEVAYSDIWTADAIEKCYGIKLDRENLMSIEQLDPSSAKLDTLSDSRLFSRNARYSKTKGARVTQLHCKDSSGGFGTWYVIIDGGADQKRIVNEDDTDTPFGGSGMPFTLLHAHWRSDSMWSRSDSDQMRGDQDKINLAETLFWRMCEKNAGYQWIIDRRFFADRPTKDSIAAQMSNQVGGLIIGDYKGRNENVQAPQLVQHPEPSLTILSVIDRYMIGSKEKVHISPGQEGKVPTHVPVANFQRAQDDADQVISVRIDKDLPSYEYIVKVMHGTMLKLAQARVPGVLASLQQEAGFDAQDFSVVATSDWRRPNINIKLREGTVRHVGKQERKQNLDIALQNQAITGEQYSSALADTLDMPLMETDRQMRTEAQKWSLRIIAGEEWQPMMLGEWANVFARAFIRASFDRKAKVDPAARQRLDRAVQSIRQTSAQEAFMANPEMQAQAAQAAASNPQTSEAVEAPSAADMLNALSQSGGANASA